MIANLCFSLALVAAIAAVLLVGLRVLPRENMQILASIPVRRRPDGLWQGINLTWYGVMQMTAAVVGVSVALILAVSAGAPAGGVALVIAVLLAVGLPAARLLAFLVEGKRGTFTVGGAVFAVAVLLPWVAKAADMVFGGRYALAIVSAVAVAYPIGEGIGRLACVSFGCCYGRPIDGAAPWLRRLFAARPAVIVGPTRKAAYAGRCAGVPLIPVPALSACVLSFAGVVAVPLFLAGSLRAAAVVALAIAFPWRFASEFLRADYRGGKHSRLSAYQWMAVFSAAYSVPVLAMLPAGRHLPTVGRGLALVTSPLFWVALVGLGGIVFAYLGVSEITTAVIELKVEDGT